MQKVEKVITDKIVTCNMPVDMNETHIKELLRSLGATDIAIYSETTGVLKGRNEASLTISGPLDDEDTPHQVVDFINTHFVNSYNGLEMTRELYAFLEDNSVITGATVTEPSYNKYGTPSYASDMVELKGMLFEKYGIAVDENADLYVKDIGDDSCTSVRLTVGMDKESAQQLTAMLDSLKEQVNQKPKTTKTPRS